MCATLIVENKHGRLHKYKQAKLNFYIKDICSEGSSLNIW